MRPAEVLDQGVRLVDWYEREIRQAQADFLEGKAKLDARRDKVLSAAQQLTGAAHDVYRRELGELFADYSARIEGANVRKRRGL